MVRRRICASLIGGKTNSLGHGDSVITANQELLGRILNGGIQNRSFFHLTLPCKIGCRSMIRMGFCNVILHCDTM